ncbi:MAG: hypothetical protein HY253_02915 [Burkholderiales bacterium]|nr:hypothetical protein [Burkholderiales bacterium]
MAKHLLYLTNHQLSEMVWENGNFSAVRTFDHYASGWSKFSDYFASQAEPDVLLLTDLIEEDFQRESLPHVFGPAQKKLIDRRLQNLYRDTPYRTASHQGREKSGRKDDLVLFSALTNPQILQPWLDALRTLKIHVVGVYSVALLKPLLFKKLKVGNAASLLVTHQSSGLRQSFFQEGHLRFSRLSPETAWSAEAIAEVAEVEVAKTRQFLASTRLLARGDPLQIVVVASAEIVNFLRPRCLNEGGLSYRFIDLDEARDLFLPKKTKITLSVCDPLFLSLLALGRIESHYATDEHTKLHKLLQLRTTLNATSIATLALACAWAANDGIKAYRATEMVKLAQNETGVVSLKYKSVLASMPMTVANPVEMKAASELEQTILKNSPRMHALLRTVSEALEPLPQVKIYGLKWESIGRADSSLDPALAAPPPLDSADVLSPATMFGIPNKQIEQLSLDCEIERFNQDYRAALTSAEQFVKDLQRDAHLQVTMLKPPFDVRPGVKLEARAGDASAAELPRFTVQIIWKP